MYPCDNKPASSVAAPYLLMIIEIVKVFVIDNYVVVMCPGLGRDCFSNSVYIRPSIVHQHEEEKKETPMEDVKECVCVCVVAVLGARPSFLPEPYSTGVLHRVREMPSSQD